MVMHQLSCNSSLPWLILLTLWLRLKERIDSTLGWESEVRSFPLLKILPLCSLSLCLPSSTSVGMGLWWWIKKRRSHFLFSAFLLDFFLTIWKIFLICCCQAGQGFHDGKTQLAQTVSEETDWNGKDKIFLINYSSVTPRNQRWFLKKLIPAKNDQSVCGFSQRSRYFGNDRCDSRNLFVCF